MDIASGIGQDGSEQYSQLPSGSAFDPALALSRYLILNCRSSAAAGQCIQSMLVLSGSLAMD
jgi:hypothetical protein